MSNRWKRWAAVMALLAVMIMSGCAADQGAAAKSTEETVVLRLATDMAEDSPGYRQLEDFKERLGNASNGRLQVKLYPTEAWSENDSLLSYLGLETLELVCVSTQRLAAEAPAFGIFDLPYLFSDRAQLAEYLTGAKGEEALALTEPLGYKALGFVGDGQQYFLQTRGPALETGWTGLTMAVAQRPLWLQGLAAAGIKTVDGESAGVFYDARCVGEAEVKKLMTQQIVNEGTYLNETEMFYNIEVVLGDAKWWHALPESDRTLISDAFDAALGQNMQTMQSTWASDVFASGGVTVDAVSAEQKLTLYQQTAGVREQYFYSGASALAGQWVTFAPEETLPEDHEDVQQ